MIRETIVSNREKNKGQRQALQLLYNKALRSYITLKVNIFRYFYNWQNGCTKLAENCSVHKLCYKHLTRFYLKMLT